MNSRLVWGSLTTAALAVASVAVLVAEPVESTDAPTGVSTFVANGCNGCHAFEGQPGNSRVGPDLTDLDIVAADRVESLTAEEYIRQSVREPQAFRVPGYSFDMPTLELTELELDQLVALLLAPDET